MKYAIHCKTTKLKWIVALSNDKKKAKEYLAKIQDKVEAELIEIPVEKFPFYIIETKGNNFEFTADFKDITKKIKLVLSLSNGAVKPKLNFDDPYFNYYILTKAFFTRPYGADRMGALKHVHVTNRELKTKLEPGVKRCPRCDKYWRRDSVIVLNVHLENYSAKQCLNCGTSWNLKNGKEVDLEIGGSDSN